MGPFLSFTLPPTPQSLSSPVIWAVCWWSLHFWGSENISFTILGGLVQIDIIHLNGSVVPIFYTFSALGHFGCFHFAVTIDETEADSLLWGVPESSVKHFALRKNSFSGFSKPRSITSKSHLSA